MRVTGVSKKNDKGEVIALCPVGLAAIVAATATSGGWVWALTRRAS